MERLNWFTVSSPLLLQYNRMLRLTYGHMETINLSCLTLREPWTTCNYILLLSEKNTRSLRLEEMNHLVFVRPRLINRKCSELEILFSVVWTGLVIMFLKIIWKVLKKNNILTSNKTCFEFSSSILFIINGCVLCNSNYEKSCCGKILNYISR